jgi:hypothetical protein
VHTSFYVLLIAMPIVGYIANSAYGAPTPFFGLLELPPIVEKNEALSTPLFAIHRWVGWLLIIPGSDSPQRGALSPLHPRRQRVATDAAARAGRLRGGRTTRGPFGRRTRALASTLQLRRCVACTRLVLILTNAD